MSLFPLKQELVLIIYVFCTLFAAAMGSFCNVVIYRVPAKRSILWPGSRCGQCDTAIKPYDNIPILSWLILGGKCRHCGCKISPQYPIIEGISMLLGLALAVQVFSPRVEMLHSVGDLGLLMMAFFFLFLFVFACLALTLIDLQYTELPPTITYPFAVVGIVFAFLLPQRAPIADLVGNVALLDSLLGALMGAGIVFVIIAVYFLATKRMGMGGGDIGMMAMVGAFLGWQSLVFIFLAASVQGLVAAVVAMALGKKQQQSHSDYALFRNDVLARDEEEGELPLQHSSQSDSARTLALPFGPFIALAAVEYLFVGAWALEFLTHGALSPWGFYF